MLNESGSFPPYSGAVQFTSNGTLFYGLSANDIVLYYWLDAEGNETIPVLKEGATTIIFVNQSYRKLTFDVPPTGDLLMWLQANGTKQ